MNWIVQRLLLAAPHLGPSGQSNFNHESVLSVHYLAETLFSFTIARDLPRAIMVNWGIL
jgi:hypothetical protein